MEYTVGRSSSYDRSACPTISCECKRLRGTSGSSKNPCDYENAGEDNDDENEDNGIQVYSVELKML